MVFDSSKQRNKFFVAALLRMTSRQSLHGDRTQRLQPQFSKERAKDTKDLKIDIFEFLNFVLFVVSRS